MKECECGHKHCCHLKVKKRVIRTKNEVGYPIRFLRKTCKEYSEWLGDIPLS